jgi:hypothetical protein
MTMSTVLAPTRDTREYIAVGYDALPWIVLMFVLRTRIEPTPSLTRRDSHDLDHLSLSIRP